MIGAFFAFVFGVIVLVGGISTGEIGQIVFGLFWIATSLWSLRPGARDDGSGFWFGGGLDGDGGDGGDGGCGGCGGCGG